MWEGKMLKYEKRSREKLLRKKLPAEAHEKDVSSGKKQEKQQKKN